MDPDNKAVSLFSSLMVVLAGTSTVLGSYFACFGEPEVSSLPSMLDIVMESCFILDMVKNFFMEYKDPSNPERKIVDLGKIIKNYVKGAFIIDFVALVGFPIHYAAKGAISQENLSLIYLSRLFRLPKSFILLDSMRFTRIVRSWFRSNLKKKI